MKPHQHALPSHFGAICAMFFVFALMSLSGAAATVARGAAPAANVESELLEPERAFQLSARRKDQKTVELQYKIAEGYYMYRGRFKFLVEPPAFAKLGRASLSKGKIKQDATFGRVETYRDSVRILLPIASIGKGVMRADAMPLRLRITSQGCADAGVCYPPLQQTLTFTPTGFDVVLPDGIDDVGGVAGSLQSSPSSAQPSLSDALKKAK